MNKHFPCGHWHKQLLYRVASIKPYWQQSLDISKASKLIGVGCPSTGIGIANTYLVGACDISLDKLIYAKEYNIADNYGIPGTTIQQGLNRPTTFYVNIGMMADYRDYVFCSRYDKKGVSCTSNIFISSDIDRLSDDWISCRMTVVGSTVIIIAKIYGTTTGHLYVYKSSNYGNSFDAGTYIAQGTFYNLGIASDALGRLYIIYTDREDKLYLLISLDGGTTWSNIYLPSTVSEGTYKATIATTGVRVYLSCNTAIGGIFTSHILMSDDQGLTWNDYAYTILDESYLSTTIAANNNTLVGYVYVYNKNKYVIARSIDCGSSWSIIGYTYPNLTWPGLTILNRSYVNLCNDTDYFALTTCGSYVTGTNYLGYLLSIDDGLTWSVHSLGISNKDSIQTIYYL